MQFFITVLMIIFCASNDLLSSENTLRIELSEKESCDLVNFYELNQWKKIEKYHDQKKISFDAQLNTGYDSRPLDVAFAEDKFDVAFKLINEKNVDVLYKKSNNGYTSIQCLLATCLVKHYGEDCKKKECINIFKNLVEKGVDINSLSVNDFPLLHMGLLTNQNTATLCIKNGAKLMIKEGDKRWNFLTLKCLGDLEFLLKLKREFSSFYNIDQRIKNVLYNKCKYDYKNYCKAYFTTVLVFKHLKSKKNIHIPKMVLNYMVTFIAPDPVEHIEETLVDAWSQQPPTLSNNVEKFETNFQDAYVDLMHHIIPKSWKNAWNDYKSVDCPEFNLVVRALKYDGAKEYLKK